ncbi:MAG: xanthine dehydrogenase family protein molybdopterin-binding subunit [Pontiella sp.]
MSEGWPKNPKYLSKDLQRVDAHDKVTGKAEYAYDVHPKGCLYGQILRSRWPAARIQSVDLSVAQKMPGVKAVILIQKVPREVRYYGQEIAAVAAETTEQAEDAIRAIKMIAKPLPFVVNTIDALEEGAPAVFEGQSNLSKAKIRNKGNVDQAFNEAHAVIELAVSTQVEVHHPLETHGNTIDASGEEITCWASTQGITSVRGGIAKALDVPNNKVRVKMDFMGGGFGAKFGAGVEGVACAQLSREAGAPVKLMLSRFENHLSVGNRPNSLQHIKLGADKNGKLVAFDLNGFGSAGFASGGSSAGGGGGAGIPAPYIYDVRVQRSSQIGVAINAGSARAFRAPGCPPASFGIESAMDELAVKLGMDPVELRIINDPQEIRSKQWSQAADRFGWKNKYKKPGSSPGVVKTGVGCAGSKWAGRGKGSSAEVEIAPDGTVEVRCGTQDIGNASKTFMTVVAAETLGISPELITARVGDTTFPPSGGSGGSTTCPSVSPAVKDACDNALEALQEASGISDLSGANWKKACARLAPNPIIAQGKWKKGLSGSGTGGVQMAEVEVDTETGFVKVMKITCVQDCGLLVNRLTAESQMNGGIIMGIGYALYEERVLDPITGVALNPNFETYKLTSMADTPEIDLELQNMPERGVIGIGEPATVPTASAIANAVANAIGVRVLSLPITPDKVLNALSKVPAPEESIPWGRVASLTAQGEFIDLNSKEWIV